MPARGDEQSRWNDLILSKGGSFLQLWEWGEFQHAYGRPIDRFTTNDVAVQTIVHDLPGGMTFLFSPYGPVGSATKSSVSAVLEKIEKLAIKYRTVFWRYERGGVQYGGRHVADVHPTTTWITELAEPKKLLTAMKQKWRYNIGIAERKGVVVTTTRDVAAVDAFYAIAQQTARRHRFRVHPKSYYQLMFNILGARRCLQMYVAQYDGRPIAFAIVLRFGTTATYLHGASDYEHRNLMASHLLHFRIMCDAKAFGCTHYDWFGISPVRWPTLSRFKQGFGGSSCTHDGTYELPFNRTWYNAYRFVKRNRLWISL